jgi:hypothetical protein
MDMDALDYEAALGDFRNVLASLPNSWKNNADSLPNIPRDPAPDSWSNKLQKYDPLFDSVMWIHMRESVELINLVQDYAKSEQSTHYEHCRVWL